MWIAAALLASLSLASEPDGADESVEPVESGDTEPLGTETPEDESEPVGTETFEDESDIEVMVVTGTRTPVRLTDSTVPTEVIGRGEIDASGADTLAQILELRAGIQVYDAYGIAGVRLRGHEPEHVLLLVDGVRVNGRVAGALDLKRIPAFAIEQVEILRGPASALYGSDALAGVINVRTRRSKDSTVAAELGIEMAGYAPSGGGQPGPAESAVIPLDYASIDAGLWGGYRNFDGRLTVAALTIAAQDRTPDTEGTTSDALGQVSVQGDTSLRSSDNLSFRLSGSYLWQDSEGFLTSDAGALLEQRNLVENGTVTLAADIGGDGPTQVNVTTHVSMFRDQYAMDQQGADDLDDYQDTRDTLAQVITQVNHQLTPGQVLSVGLEGTNEYMVSERLNGGRGQRQRLALYAQDDWRVFQAPRLAVQPGIRVDADSLFGWWGTPSIAVRIDPHPALQVRAHYGMGYRAPDFKQLYLAFDNPAANYRVEGNPELGPEYSHGTGLDVEAMPLPWMTVGLTGWLDDVSNLIQADLTSAAAPGVPAIYSYVNVDRARIQGIEASSDFIIGSASLILGLAYTFTNARDLTAERLLSGRSPHQASGTLRWNIPVWDLGVFGRVMYMGKRPFYVGEETLWVSDYVQLDLRSEVKLTPQVSLQIGVDNVLDAGDPSYDPLRPRRFYGGLTGSFGGARGGS